MTTYWDEVLTEDPANVCGIVDKEYKVIAAYDALIDGDWHEYETAMQDKEHGANKLQLDRLLIQRHDRPWRSNNAVSRALVALNQLSSPYTPRLIVAGPCPRLTFGLSKEQEQERDPLWTRKPVAIVESVGPQLAEVHVWASASIDGKSSLLTMPVDYAITLGIACIRALGAIHSAGFVSRFVTPFTMALRINEQDRTKTLVDPQIVVTDFSLCLAWPCQPRGYVPFVGTLRYSSLRAHRGGEQGPADDVISVVYMITEWISGRLPWWNEKSKKKVMQSKISFPSSKQFKALPHELRALYRDMQLTLAQTPLNYPDITGRLQAAQKRYETVGESLPNFLSKDTAWKA